MDMRTLSSNLSHELGQNSDLDMANKEKLLTIADDAPRFVMTAAPASIKNHSKGKKKKKIPFFLRP